MNDLLKLITSQEAGNLGDLFSGLTIAFIALAYWTQGRQRNVRDFQKKVTQTFYYGRKFKEYYEKFFFLHFFQYIQALLVDKIPEEKFELNDYKGVKLTGGAAVETVNQEVTDFFLFLQELMYVLRKNKYFNFIDEEELGKVIKSYASQMKDFFSVVDIFTAQRRSHSLQGWGHMNESDFITLKSYFQNKYDFLK